MIAQSRYLSSENVKFTSKYVDEINFYNKHERTKSFILKMR